MLTYCKNYHLSQFQTNFIDIYYAKYRTHKLFVEFPIIDFIKLKEKKFDKKLDPIHRKRVRKLRFDVYDYTVDRVFEISGEQHFEYNSLFHKDIGGLDRQKVNDYLKQEICNFFGTELFVISDVKDIGKY
jgi:hypothetical protein